MSPDPCRFCLVRLGCVALACLFLASCETEQRPSLSDHAIDTDIELTIASSGKPFSIDEQRGKALWIFFGFTNCPDICPITLRRLTQAHDLLDYRRDRVATVFVSLDPERDDPDRIASYLSYFEMPTIGLTGNEDEVRKAAEQFFLHYERVDLPDSALEYTIDHPGRIFLVDPEGRVRYLFDGTESAGKIAAITRQVLPAL